MNGPGARAGPPVRPVQLLAVAQFTNAIGDGAFYACSALFSTQVLGLRAFRGTPFHESSGGQLTVRHGLWRGTSAHGQ